MRFTVVAFLVLVGCGGSDSQTPDASTAGGSAAGGSAAGGSAAGGSAAGGSAAGGSAAGGSAAGGSAAGGSAAGGSAAGGSSDAGMSGPLITGVVVRNITSSSANVSWTLNTPSTGQVEYGTTTAYGSFSVRESSFNYSSHTQPLSNLNAGTTYHFRVRSSNPAGIESISADSSFITLQAGGGSAAGGSAAGGGAAGGSAAGGSAAGGSAAGGSAAGGSAAGGSAAGGSAAGGSTAGGSAAGSADAGVRPLGGPAGYVQLVVNDSFGSNKPGANITSTAQLNPATPYGATGTGWDLWARNFNQTAGSSARATMTADHLELVPTNDPSRFGAGFMVSHFEPLPSATTSYYLEARFASGRGRNGGSSWPAFWLFPGNEPGAGWQAWSEIDIMETYGHYTIGPIDPSTGLYTQYFMASGHQPVSDGGTALSTEALTFVTPGNDVTINYNVYGCELTLRNGRIFWAIYLNGTLVGTSAVGVPWQASPPAMWIGWNPGSSPYSPAVLKLDWVRVWRR